MAAGISSEKNKNHFGDAFANLQRQRQQKLFCDMELKVSGKVFPVHRNILALCSPVFENILKETTRSCIEFTDQKPEIMEIILDYIYTGDLRLHPDTATDLLKAAHFFQIKWIKDVCSNYLAMIIDTFNCLSIWNVAEYCGCENLTCIAKKYMKDNLENLFSVIRKSKSTLELNTSTTNKTNTHAENKATSSLTKTQKANSIINLKTIKNEILIFNRSISRPYFKLNPFTGKTVDLPWSFTDLWNYTPVYYKNKIYTIGGVTRTKQYVNKSYCFDLETNQWDAGKLIIPVNRITPGTTIIDDKLYVIGGSLNHSSGNCNPTFICNCYDFTTDRLFQKSSMKKEIYNFGIVNFGGSIYVCGGQSWATDSPNSSVERFDPREGRWFSIPSMRGIKGQCTATIWNDKLYVKEMFETSDSSLSIERFCFKTNFWTKLQMESERSQNNSHLILLNNGLLSVDNGGVFQFSGKKKKWNLSCQVHDLSWDIYSCIGIE